MAFWTCKRCKFVFFRRPAGGRCINCGAVEDVLDS